MSISSELRTAVTNLVTTAVGTDAARRPFVIVVPNGPPVLLATVLGTAKRSAALLPVYIHAQQVIADSFKGDVVRQAAVFFEPLDAIEHSPKAQRFVLELLSAAGNGEISFTAYSRKPVEQLKFSNALLDLLNNRRRVDVETFSVGQLADDTDLQRRARLVDYIMGHPSLQPIAGNHVPIFASDVLDFVELLQAEMTQERAALPAPLATTVDTETGLEMPPKPRTLYTNRAAKYGSKISVTEFLEREWGDYTRHHLLYAEHIRTLLDPGLYRALHYQASETGAAFEAFLFAHGILGKSHILTPPKGYERQVQIIQRLRHSARSEAMTLMAKKLDAVLLGPARSPRSKTARPTSKPST